MKKCKKCGAELADSAKECPNCSAKVSKTGMGKNILAVIFIAIILIAVINAFSNRDKKEEEPTETSPSGIQLLINEGLSESEASAIMSDLNSVGIEELTSLGNPTGQGVDKVQSYAFSSEEVAGILTIENRKTYYIASGDIELFNATKGGKVDDISRYILTQTEEVEFMLDAEDCVKKGLKAPSTAKFPSRVFDSEDWKVKRKDDVVTVSSYVDAQNDFGAMIRSNFVVQISYSTSSCLYLEIDGQAMYGEYHS